MRGKGFYFNSFKRLNSFYVCTISQTLGQITFCTLVAIEGHLDLNIVWNAFKKLSRVQSKNLIVITAEITEVFS